MKTLGKKTKQVIFGEVVTKIAGVESFWLRMGFACSWNPRTLRLRIVWPCGWVSESNSPCIRHAVAAAYGYVLAWCEHKCWPAEMETGEEPSDQHSGSLRPADQSPGSSPAGGSTDENKVAAIEIVVNPKTEDSCNE